MLRFILWILAMLGVRVVRLWVSRLAPVECAGLDPPTVTLNVSTRPGEIGSPTGRTVASVK